MEKSRASKLAANDNAQLQKMRDHNHGFVTVVEPRPAQKSISSTVASSVSGVAGETKAERREQARQESQLRQFAGDLDELAEPAALETATSDDGQSGTDDEFSAEGLL